ncbi:MAG TPA: hypothetical protein DCS93_13025 [Microscillaceae bacterium]|nr:hypothetical protein [Microscillaceae bacterium]
MNNYHFYTHTVRLFYELLEQKDLKRWMKLWAKDAKNIFPYSSLPMPHTLEGIVNIRQFWSSTPKMYARLSFLVNEIYIKPHKATVFFESHHLIRDSPKHHKDLNIGVFEFNERGKIQCYTEYFDPINLGQTFQMLHITKMPGSTDK